VVAPVVQAAFESASELAASDRGEGGFGSTGRK
jgi:dUTPase